jgi:hypothetical protein
MSVFFIVSLFAPTMARPMSPPPVPQSGLPNQQWPPFSIEHAVSSIPPGQPSEETHLVSPPLTGCDAGAVVVPQPSFIAMRLIVGACSE